MNIKKIVSAVSAFVISVTIICMNNCLLSDCVDMRYIEVDKIEIMKDYLLGKRGINKAQFDYLDLNSDSSVDVFDYALMRNEFAEKNGLLHGKQAKLIEVQNILQNPELPTGCEVTSLTILLNYLGYSIDKMTMARNYLPKQDFYWENGIYYGADFRTTFAGNPESEYSYGCYAPCIVTTADNYFQDNGVNASANDLTGTDFDSLLADYIDNNMPVLIWITSSNLHESSLTSIWTTPDGEEVQWRAYEHCVVLTGYDKDNQLLYVSDPLYGDISYDYDILVQRYKELGQQAVYIQ